VKTVMEGLITGRGGLTGSVPHVLGESLLLFLHNMTERLPWPAQGQLIVPVGMELDLWSSRGLYRAPT
jgi:hypothetical protein